MRRVLHEPPAFAGEGDKEVVPAVTTARACKAVRKDAAFQIPLEGFAHIGHGAVVVALPVELACAGQVKPGLVMLGETVAAHGRVHGLVNNAGRLYLAPLKKISAKGWQVVIDTNLTGG
jgi:NAD(P)-dependent dehydrogenase (short-subunit alcohol dehydrogenase family)